VDLARAGDARGVIFLVGPLGRAARDLLLVLMRTVGNGCVTVASTPRSIVGTRAVPAMAGSGNKSATGNNANTNRENARRSMAILRPVMGGRVLPRSDPD
jgi:hypothetical protein